MMHKTVFTWRGFLLLLYCLLLVVPIELRADNDVEDCREVYSDNLNCNLPSDTILDFGADNNSSSQNTETSNQPLASFLINTNLSNSGDVSVDENPTELISDSKNSKLLTLEKWRDRIYSDIEREKKRDLLIVEKNEKKNISEHTLALTEDTASLPVQTEEKQRLGRDLSICFFRDKMYWIETSQCPEQTNNYSVFVNTSVSTSTFYGHHFYGSSLHSTETNIAVNAFSQRRFSLLSFGKHVKGYLRLLLNSFERLQFYMLKRLSWDMNEAVSHDGFNFASIDAGARILAVRNMYMLSPCKYKRWIVVELSEEILLKRIEIANFEYFSSFPESVAVLGSQSFPTDKWILLQIASFNQSRDIQYFEMQEEAFIRYLKLLFIGVQGNEFFCTISLVRVFGKRLVDDWKEALEQSNRDKRVAAEVMAGVSLKKQSSASDLSFKGSQPSKTLPLLIDSKQTSQVSHDDTANSSISVNKESNQTSDERARSNISKVDLFSKKLQNEHTETFSNITSFSEAVEESIFRQLTRILRQLELNQSLVSQYVELHLAEYAANLAETRKEALYAKQESERVHEQLEKIEQTISSKRNPLKPKRCWYIAFCAAAMNFLQVSCFFISPAVLMPLIVKEMNVSLALAPLPIAIGKVAYVLFLIPEGILLDTIGPCLFLLIGFAGLSVVSFGYSLFVQSFKTLCYFHVLLAVFASISGVPVYSLLLSELFKENLGLALGFVLSGFSLAGTVVPFSLGPLASQYGWRLIWKILSLSLITAGVGVSFYVWRSFPAARESFKEYESSLRGSSSPLSSPRHSRKSRLLTGKQSSSDDIRALSTRSVTRRSLSQRRMRIGSTKKLPGLSSSGSVFSPIYFSLMVCYICSQYAYGCFNENILFFLTVDAGFSLGHASLILSLINCAAFAAKLVGGHLGDTHDRYRLASVSSATAAAGIIVLFLPGTSATQFTRLPSLGTSSFQFFVFALAFGAGYGSTFNCLYAIVPNVFPLSKVGIVQSSLFGFGLCGNAVGALATGSLREWTGSYDISFSISFVMFCISFVVFHALEVVEHHMGSSNVFFEEPVSPSSSVVRHSYSEATIPLSNEQTATYGSRMEDANNEGESFLKQSSPSISLIGHSKTFSSLVDRGFLSYSFEHFPTAALDSLSDDDTEEEVEAGENEEVN
eukprot:jgi/Galph1/4226/GphlegSOOS_G2922.1